MINVIDLRNRGIKAINEEIENNGFATLTYRGKPKYIILEINEYEKLREAELLIAYNNAKKDIQNQNAETVKTQTELKNHINNLKEFIKE
ncbi:MAG: prevent-host-death protein [Epsilonproteobacteria bacterium]|nr:prevent-host-death protein [Campylobacterota bacterium]